MLLSEAIDQFIAANRHRWAPSTANWYKRMAMSLLNFLSDVEVEAITAQDLRDWLYWQVAEKKYSDNTRSGMYIAVSMMFQHLADKGVVENHFAKLGNHLDRPKIREQVQSKAKHNVVFDFLSFIEKEAEGYANRNAYLTNKVAVRDLAMLWLMIATGCRRIEVVRLQMEDFEVQNIKGQRTGVIRFIGKGLKQRRNYIAQKSLQAMETWLAMRPEPSSDHNSIFLTLRHRSHRPLQERVVNNRISQWAKKGGFEGETLNPHSFRRAFATYAASKGVPITVIQKQLGHKDVKTTMRYIKHDEEALFAQSKYIINVLEDDWKSRE